MPSQYPCPCSTRCSMLHRYVENTHLSLPEACELCLAWTCHWRARGHLVRRGCVFVRARRPRCSLSFAICSHHGMKVVMTVHVSDVGVGLCTTSTANDCRSCSKACSMIARAPACMPWHRDGRGADALLQLCRALWTPEVCQRSGWSTFADWRSTVHPMAVYMHSSHSARTHTGIGHPARCWLTCVLLNTLPDS